MCIAAIPPMSDNSLNKTTEQTWNGICDTQVELDISLQTCGYINPNNAPKGNLDGFVS